MSRPAWNLQGGSKGGGVHSQKHEATQVHRSATDSGWRCRRRNRRSRGFAPALEAEERIRRRKRWKLPLAISVLITKFNLGDLWSPAALRIVNCVSAVLSLSYKIIYYHCITGLRHPPDRHTTVRSLDPRDFDLDLHDGSRVFFLWYKYVRILAM